MKKMPKIKLDAAKLHGFKLTSAQEVKSAPAIEPKIGMPKKPSKADK